MGRDVLSSVVSSAIFLEMQRISVPNTATGYKMSRQGYTGSGDIEYVSRNVLPITLSHTYRMFVQSEPYLPHSVSLMSPEWVVLPVMDKPSRTIFINRLF